MKVNKDSIKDTNHFHPFSLFAFVDRTSFQCAPGELVPAPWKAPEVALSVVVPAYNEDLWKTGLVGTTTDGTTDGSYCILAISFHLRNL